MSNTNGLSTAVKRYVNGRESRVARLRALSNIQTEMNRIIKGWNSNQVNQTARIRVGPNSLNTVKQKLSMLANRVKGIKVPDRFLAYFRRAKANIAAGNAQAAVANTNKAAAEVGLPPPLPPKPNSMRAAALENMNKKNQNFKNRVRNATNKNQLNSLMSQLNTNNVKSFMTPNNRMKLKANIKSKLNNMRNINASNLYNNSKIKYNTGPLRSSQNQKLLGIIPTGQKVYK